MSTAMFGIFLPDHFIFIVTSFTFPPKIQKVMHKKTQILTDFYNKTSQRSVTVKANAVSSWLPSPFSACACLSPPLTLLLPGAWFYTAIPTL